MKRILVFSVVGLALILSACAPSAGATPVGGMPDNNMNNNNGNMPMGGNNQPADMTATPGSMMADNPEAAHMMEPISAPNAQPATETEGGQPLAFREENGVKVFELTAKAVLWPILDGMTVTAYT